MFEDPWSTVQFIKKCNKIQQRIKIFIIPYLFEAQNVSGDTLPIIRSLKLYWQPLVFHMLKVVGRVVGPPTTRPTTFHLWKTRGFQCSFRLLMMGGVLSETCWASDKYGIIKILIPRCILLDLSVWMAEDYCGFPKSFQTLSQNKPLPLPSTSFIIPQSLIILITRSYKESLTLRRLMPYIYIYGAPILDVSRSHTTTQHSR